MRFDLRSKNRVRDPRGGGGKLITCALAHAKGGRTAGG